MNKFVCAASLLCLLPLSQYVCAITAEDVTTYLTAVSKAGHRIVAVGERGNVLLSDDEGRNWQHVDAGVSSTLTAVKFVDDQVGFALGHGGTILRTSDAGQTWKTMLEGSQVVKLTQQAAVAISADPTQKEKATELELYAKRLEDSAASDPLFDMLFLGDQQILVVGAYGMVLRSEDAGATWQVWMAHVDNTQEFHLYAITQAAGAIYLAGEQGYLARSLDQGKTFSKVQTDVGGSFFTLQTGNDGEVLAAGLQGNMVSIENSGETWTLLDTQSTGTLIDSEKSDDGSIYFSDINGRIEKLAGRTLTPVQHVAVPVSAFTIVTEGSFVVVGASGIKRITAEN
ncbi:WD40/YVTN/BNR-like repeat-containing protein [Pseudomonas brassicacearum]|uniref:WD40/YVTN/BNR-like repeat-containing protein n=1 Tax=Pseudomonas brassicacearum TaxID=930166 RepID=UPI001D6C2FBC|nr:YCF48-related protein [Pseudomonas brassicacearum]CAH0156681.1 Ycf48-like protein [Pseudomonas brassicacearum]